MATAAVASPGDGFAMMSRPQIGIDRLPVRRQSNEPKEAMNCKVNTLMIFIFLEGWRRAWRHFMA